MAEMIDLKEMKEREKVLGYMPIWAAGDCPARYMGVTLGTYGHHSAGNEMDVMHAVLGPKVQGNPAQDILNSKLVVIWSTDTRTTQPQHSFLLAVFPPVFFPFQFCCTHGNWS